MVRDKEPKPPGQGKMDRYAKPEAPPLEAAGVESTLPDNAALPAAIQSSREALEGRTGEVRSEVTLLRQDLRNVADRVTETESRTSDLGSTVTTLKKRGQ